MLQTMIKQGRGALALYQRANRLGIAQQEAEEIALIESFLPLQLDQGEIEAAAAAAIREIGATTQRHVGEVMAVSRERHAGVIDPGCAGAIVRPAAGMTVVGFLLFSLTRRTGRGEGGQGCEVRRKRASSPRCREASACAVGACLSAWPPERGP